MAVQRYTFLPSELLGDQLDAVDHGVVDGGLTTFATPGRVAASDDLVEVQLPDKWGYGLVPNHEHDHVGRRAVRQAIMHVIDRDAVAQAAGPRTKEPVPVPTAVPVDDQERWLGDAVADFETYGVDESRTERAAELLRDAGYETADRTWVDESGAAVEPPITVPEGWLDWVDATEAVVEQLRAFGFRSEVDARPITDLTDGAWPDGDFVLAAWSWLPGRNAAFPSVGFEHQFAETGLGLLDGYPGGGDGETDTVTVPERDGDSDLAVRPVLLGSRMTRATDRSEAKSVAREGAWVANRDLPMLPVVEKRQQLFYDGDRVELPPIDDGAYRFWLPTAWLLRTGKLRTTEGEAEPAVVDGTLATDPDDDGIYEDLNGNGEVDYADLVALFQEV